MIGRPKVPLVLTTPEQQALDSLAHRARTAPQVARRARIVLACARGLDNQTVAKKLRVSPQMVGRKPGATRKVIARNHQVLGVNRAVASVSRQEELKLEFPSEQRLRHRVVELPLESAKLIQEVPDRATARSPFIPEGPIDIIERAHPDLGRLGVFWHTQGSGKSYSMAFFAEKVRRKLEGNFTFLLMTDRKDLDGQIDKTFVGCGIADDQTPRVASGDELEQLLQENHRYVFSLIHKFNKNVDPKQPYSERDDIIVISDEVHRTQAGRLARNMRLALPTAAFIGFTGTPLFGQALLRKSKLAPSAPTRRFVTDRSRTTLVDQARSFD